MCGPQGLQRGCTDTDVFAHGLGTATVFVPVGTPIDDVGRVRVVEIPAADLAVTVHHGSHDDIDQAYGSLASYVAESAISLDGPIRETYLTSFARRPTPTGGRPRSAGRSSTPARHNQPDAANTTAVPEAVQTIERTRVQRSSTPPKVAAARTWSLASTSADGEPGGQADSNDSESRHARRRARSSTT